MKCCIICGEVITEEQEARSPDREICDNPNCFDDFHGIFTAAQRNRVLLRLAEERQRKEERT